MHDEFPWNHMILYHSMTWPNRIWHDLNLLKFIRSSNEVLTFVNKIAEIVHTNVHSWRGQCNKNLGNAFTVVWRIGDEESLLVSQNSSNKTSTILHSIMPYYATSFYSTTSTIVQNFTILVWKSFRTIQLSTALYHDVRHRLQCCVTL